MKTASSMIRKKVPLLKKIRFFRNLVLALFPSRKKALLKKDEHRAKRRVESLKLRLLDLGFSRRALQDLRDLLEDDRNPFLKKYAARELARWYANQRDEAGARESLRMLSLLKEGEVDIERLRQAAIMEAEGFARLGSRDKGRSALDKALALGPHGDLYLALANLEPTLQGRLEWINKALELYGLSPVRLEKKSGRPPFDWLQAVPDTVMTPGHHKVTVIVPVHNAGSTIKTALDSLLCQTWTNLEILAVDDCSTDSTAAIIAGYAARDPRVKYLQMAVNQGPYAARNLALEIATGGFVTCHDADDWSHPGKIAAQARHLLENPTVAGNTSRQVRVTPDLRVYRRGKHGILVFKNYSSFMFRRELMQKKAGYWDSVRFSADSELIRRLKKICGNRSVVHLDTGPLSFMRQWTGSLTADENFGVDGFYMGARREYYESQISHHQAAANLRYDFPQKPRPFHVPEPMWLNREAKPGSQRHFDIILVSDFRLPGDTNLANAEMIKVQKQRGLRTGLVQMCHYDLNPKLRILPHIRELLDGNYVQMLVYGEKVSCDLLLLSNPAVLQEHQMYLPAVEAKNVHVIVHQGPQAREPDSLYSYDIKRCCEQLQVYFGRTGTWHSDYSWHHHSARLQELLVRDRKVLT